MDIGPGAEEKIVKRMNRLHIGSLLSVHSTVETGPLSATLRADGKGIDQFMTTPGGTPVSLLLSFLSKAYPQPLAANL
jgi:hypothetical protein